MNILEYLKALGKHWWALMSCAVFTILGLYVAYANKGNEWTVRSIFGAALALLLVAGFRSWLDEHKRADLLEMELGKVSKKYLEKLPQLGVRVTNTSGGSSWLTLTSGYNDGIVFHLRHLAGRPVSAIKFDPIYSLGGNYSLFFHAISFIAESEEIEMNFEILKNGERPHRKAIALAGWSKWFGEFIFDGRIERFSTYPLTIWYKDNGEIRSQQFHLVFDSSNYHLEITEDLSLAYSHVPQP